VESKRAYQNVTHAPSHNFVVEAYPEDPEGPVVRFDIRDNGDRKVSEFLLEAGVARALGQALTEAAEALGQAGR
jgi:hypothetical protein